MRALLVAFPREIEFKDELLRGVDQFGQGRNSRLREPTSNQSRRSLMKSFSRVVALSLVVVIVGILALGGLIAFAVSSGSTDPSDTATIANEQASPATTTTVTTTPTTTTTTLTIFPTGDLESQSRRAAALHDGVDDTTQFPVDTFGEVTVYPGPNGWNAYVDQVEDSMLTVWVDQGTLEPTSHFSYGTGHLFAWYGNDFFGVILQEDYGRVVAFSGDDQTRTGDLDLTRGVRLRLPDRWEDIEVNSWVDPESQSTLIVRLVDDADREFRDEAFLSDELVAVWPFPQLTTDGGSHSGSNITVFVDAVDETIPESDGTRIIRRVALADRTIEFEAFIDDDAPETLEDVLFTMSFSEIFDERFDIGRDKNLVNATPVDETTRSIYEVDVRFGPGTSSLEVAVQTGRLLNDRSAWRNTALRTTEGAWLLRSDQVTEVPRPLDCVEGCETTLWVTEGPGFSQDNPEATYVFFGEVGTEVSMTQIESLPGAAHRIG